MDLRKIDEKIAAVLGWRNLRVEPVKFSPEDGSVFPLHEDSDAWDREHAKEELIGTPPTYKTEEVEQVPYWSSTWGVTELIDWFKDHDIHVFLNTGPSGSTANILWKESGMELTFPIDVQAPTPYQAIAVVFLHYHQVELPGSE